VPVAVTMLLTVLAAAAFSVFQILGAHPARWGLAWPSLLVSRCCSGSS
jgi:hypothetical protein